MDENWLHFDFEDIETKDDVLRRYYDLVHLSDRANSGEPLSHAVHFDNPLFVTWQEFLYVHLYRAFLQRLSNGINSGKLGATFWTLAIDLHKEYGFQDPRVLGYELPQLT